MAKSAVPRNPVSVPLLLINTYGISSWFAAALIKQEYHVKDRP
ncbi:hypothetical protein [Candidatus Nitrospira nitrosa]|nr:hypothetical protein [Candidatus Nitrospira nitrosa]